MATVSGTLVNDVKSSYGSPYVHYSCTYVSTRENTTTATISVALSFKAWLQSSSSTLGTGKSLIIYARLNGGTWQSVTAKSSSASWSGTTKRDAPTLTVTGTSTSDKINIEFYVARGDSTGNSGKLGTKSSPKSYSAKLPTYSAVTPEPEPEPTPTPTIVKSFRYNINGTYHKAQRYEKINDVWVETQPRVNINNAWKKGVS